MVTVGFSWMLAKGFLRRKQKAVSVVSATGAVRPAHGCRWCPPGPQAQHGGQRRLLGTAGEGRRLRGPPRLHVCSEASSLGPEAAPKSPLHISGLPTRASARHLPRAAAVRLQGHGCQHTHTHTAPSAEHTSPAHAARGPDGGREHTGASARPTLTQQTRGTGARAAPGWQGWTPPPEGDRPAPGEEPCPPYTLQRTTGRRARQGAEMEQDEHSRGPALASPTPRPPPGPDGKGEQAGGRRAALGDSTDGMWTRGLDGQGGAPVQRLALELLPGHSRATPEPGRGVGAPSRSWGEQGRRPRGSLGTWCLGGATWLWTVSFRINPAPPGQGPTRSTAERASPPHQKSWRRRGLRPSLGLVAPVCPDALRPCWPQAGPPGASEAEVPRCPPGTRVWGGHEWTPALEADSLARLSSATRRAEGLRGQKPGSFVRQGRWQSPAVAWTEASPRGVPDP